MITGTAMPAARKSRQTWKPSRPGIIRSRITASGRELALTTKEYALLEYLAREQGRVVSRAEIAEHVWDENFDPLTNVIDVHINRLRRKVDTGFSTRLIHTRRGAGYMLAALDQVSKSPAADSATLAGPVSGAR